MDSFSFGVAKDAWRQRERVVHRVHFLFLKEWNSLNTDTNDLFYPVLGLPIKLNRADYGGNINEFFKSF